MWLTVGLHCLCTMHRAYAEHYEADHTQEFLAGLDKLDVPYSLEVLKHPDVGELVRGEGCHVPCTCKGHVLLNLPSQDALSTLSIVSATMAQLEELDVACIFYTI